VAKGIIKNVDLLLSDCDWNTSEERGYIVLDGFDKDSDRTFFASINLKDMEWEEDEILTVEEYHKSVLKAIANEIDTLSKDSDPSLEAIARLILDLENAIKWYEKYKEEYENLYTKYLGNANKINNKKGI
jgi:hypothetical protein